MIDQCDGLVILSAYDFYHITWKQFKELDDVGRQTFFYFLQYNSQQLCL